MNEVVNAVKARGWITYDEASEVMAKIGATQGNVRKFLRRLDTAGVEVTVKQGKNRKSDRRRTAKSTEKTNVLSAEPVQTYLDWMGSVSLLTREGEVELARQIERGRQIIFDAVVEQSRASRSCYVPSIRTYSRATKAPRHARRPKPTPASQPISSGSCTRPSPPPMPTSKGRRPRWSKPTCGWSLRSPRNTSSAACPSWT
ncbi:MAG: hypothetical protein JRH14_09755 [Deltaproteobacteria bacterium]|nr:hypothetical protein [Deltaproteobacteria bacterium]